MTTAAPGPVRRRAAQLKKFSTRTLPRTVQLEVGGRLGSHRRPGALIVLHTARCGSTVLGGLLGQHPRIHDDGEIYLDPLTRFDECGTSPVAAEFDPVAHLRSRMHRSGSRWYVCDAQFDHIARCGTTLPEFLDAVTGIGVTHVAVLRRMNLLRKVVSTLLSQSRGTWHLPHGSADQQRRVTVPAGTFEIDGSSGTLVEHLDRVSAWYERAEGLDGDFRLLRLEYETDLMDDPGRGYERVLEFLGVPPRPAEPTTARLNTRDLDAVVDNLDEVRAWLVGTPYAWMAEAPRSGTETTKEPR